MEREKERKRNIYRERERGREKYIERERERFSFFERERERPSQFNYILLFPNGCLVFILYYCLDLYLLIVDNM